MAPTDRYGTGMRYSGWAQKSLPTFDLRAHLMLRKINTLIDSVFLLQSRGGAV